MSYSPVMLLIVDGCGVREEAEDNAFAQANKPNIDRLCNDYPNCLLSASGVDVGLKAGQMGDSNVGHLNIGAGRIVFQDLVKISKSIEDKTFFDNKTLLAAMESVKSQKSVLHIMGLLSDGGVHSHISHLFALIDLAREQQVPRVAIHAFLDGRDVCPTAGADFLARLEDHIHDWDGCRIATVSGRFYAMDRDQRWQRVECAFKAMVHGEGCHAVSAVTAVRDAYAKGESDEFFLPTVIDDGADFGRIGKGDEVIFYNFRSDRAREISRALTEPVFNSFDRGEFTPVSLTMMTEYADDIKGEVIFPREHLPNTLGEVVSKAGIPQLRVAETEKYAHVTFFFNGGEDEVFPGEERVLIPSPKVETYDLKPEMSAYAVTDAVLDALSKGKHGFYVVNLANLDMVGHTGVMKAAITAVETVDRCVGLIAEAVLKADGALLITSDHGNVEQMSLNGAPHPAHTSNLVRTTLVSQGEYRLQDGILADIAPTILQLLGLKQPSEMTGKSLITKGEVGN